MKRNETDPRRTPRTSAGSAREHAPAITLRHPVLALGTLLALLLESLPARRSR